MGRSRWEDHFQQRGGMDVGVAREMGLVSPSGVSSCPPDLTASPGMVPRGANPADSPMVRLVFPPRIEKLVQSVDFRINNYRLVLPAGVGSTVLLASFRLPTGAVGWLQNFAQSTLAQDGTTDVTWTLRINDYPVPGFDNVRNVPGLANLLITGDDDMRIRLPNGCKVDVLITNNAASGPWTLGALVQGWYHPEVAEQRAFGDANNI